MFFDPLLARVVKGMVNGNLYKCPRCNQPLIYRMPKCDNCGQPLDWRNL